MNGQRTLELLTQSKPELRPFIEQECINV